MQRARIVTEHVGLTRISEEQRTADLRRIMEGLAGYLSSYGAITNRDTLPEIFQMLPYDIASYEQRTRVSFTNRIRDKRQKLWTP